MNREQATKILRIARKLARAVNDGGCPLRSAGDRWEKKFSRLSKERGFVVTDPSERKLPYDRIVNGLRVQCKQRKTLPSGRVTLCICARGSRGVTKEAYLRGEFDVLALRCDGVVYIIPASALDSDDGITMRNSIRPKDYSAYVDNWGAFRDGGGYRRASQLRFEF